MRESKKENRLLSMWYTCMCVRKLWGMNCTLPFMYLWVGFLRSVCIWLWIVAVIQQIPTDKIHFLFLTLAWTLSLSALRPPHTALIFFKWLQHMQNSLSRQLPTFHWVNHNLHLFSLFYYILFQRCCREDKQVQNITILPIIPLAEHETRISDLKLLYSKCFRKQIIN